jgi:hypothetical protein
MSKIISNLEVLIKPIAPKIPDPAGTDTNPISRTSVQGFFLTVSNLKKELLTFELNVIISPTATGSSIDDREFTQPVSSTLIDNTLFPILVDTNYIIASDIAGNNVFSLFKSRVVLASGAVSYITNPFSLPGNQTMSVQILPNVLNDSLRIRAGVEIRGYVSIDTVTTFKKSGSGGLGSFPVFLPVRPSYEVLVTPEYRGTIIPNAGSINEVDQTAYSLTVAGGNSILSEPERSGFTFISGNLIDTPIAMNSERLTKIAKMNITKERTKEIKKMADEIIAGNNNLANFRMEIEAALTQEVL